MPNSRRCGWHVLAGAALLAVLVAGADPDKKLLVFGYNTQLPEDLAANQALYEASPFQGMVIGVKVATPRRLAPDRTVDRFDWLAWGEAMTDADIADACRVLAARPDSATVTEFFLRFNIAPGGVDWFDDDAWARRVTHNWRLAGRLVRAGRLRGILFDTEQYAQAADVFGFAGASQAGRHSWPECVERAFQRGREAAVALNTEVTDLDVLLTFAHASAAERLRHSDDASLRDLPCSLMPAFLDGFLAGKSPQTRFFDGWENAYRYKTRQEFADAAVAIRSAAARISLVPELYLANVHTSFGIWICDNKSRWGKVAPYYTGETLEATLRWALEFSDRYVWIYQERIHPWKEPEFPDEYWRAIRNAAAPYAGLPESRPLTARRSTRPRPAAVKPAATPRLIGHWPLAGSLANTVSGSPDFEPLPGTVAEFAPVGRRAIPTLKPWTGLRLPQVRRRAMHSCTLSAMVFVIDAADTLALPVFAGAPAPGLPPVELVARGDGGALRWEVTAFDPDTGAAVGWQSSAADYLPYTPYAVSLTVRDGAVVGLFVNGHQAVFGLWDVAHRPDVPRRTARRDGLRVGAFADAPAVAGSPAPVGWIAGVRVYDGELDRPSRDRLAAALPGWEFEASPDLILLDLAEPVADGELLPDRWPIPLATPFRRRSAVERVPEFAAVDGRRGLRFQPDWKAWLEAVSISLDSQPLDRCAYTITFRLNSLPPAGAAYGLFGRGDGTAANTSFGVYVEPDGRVLGHVRTTTNFAKKLVSEPGQVKAGTWHTLTFALDAPDGTLSLTLDGRTSATAAISHGVPQVQALRRRQMPLRIGYVRVDEEYAPSHPEPKDCYLDGVISEFRLERK